MDGKYIKSAFKIFVIMAVIALVGQLISFGIYYYNVRNFENRNFNKGEKERCAKILSGEEEGDLTDYSYCKNFVRWLETNSRIDE